MNKRKAEASQIPCTNIYEANSTIVIMKLIKTHVCKVSVCVFVCVLPGVFIFQDEEEPFSFISSPGAVSKARPCSAWE